MGEEIDAMPPLSDATARELSITRVDLSSVAREVSEQRHVCWIQRAGLSS